MDSEDAVERDFKSGGLSYIDAIERLQGLGVEPHKAEMKVCQWDDDNEAEKVGP
jgi:hypothetical protein